MKEQLMTLSIASTAAGSTSALANTTIASRSTAGADTKAGRDHRATVGVTRVSGHSVPALAAIPAKQSCVSTVTTARRSTDTDAAVPAIRVPAEDAAARSDDRATVRVARVAGLRVATIASRAGAEEAGVAAATTRSGTSEGEASVTSLG